MMKILHFSSLIFLFSVLIGTTFSTVIRNNISDEQQEPYTTVVSEKTTENILSENDHSVYDKTSTMSEQDETTTACTEETHNPVAEESTFMNELITNGQTTENMENLETTTCTEETHTHNELTTYQPESENDSTKNKQNVSEKDENDEEDANTENVLIESTSTTQESYITPCTDDKLITETTTFSEKKADAALMNKFEYIREKLKPALSEKLRGKGDDSIKRQKRQTPASGSQQIQSNHSPVYRSQQIPNNVNSNGQKPKYYPPQYTQQQVTPRYYDNVNNKGVVRVPVKVKQVANNSLPPNSGYPYPIDSYLAYTNINRNNRYSTINSANRRQFQQNRPPVPTRRATPKPITRKKKFRPMPVFA